ncbi:MAG: RCC1 domain-containing protein, partial [Phycisphaerales bacterium]
MKSMKIRPRMISSILSATAAVATASAASAGTIWIAVSSAINVDPGDCGYEPRQIVTAYTPPVATAVAYLTDISAVSIAARLSAGDVVVIPDQETGSILGVWGANTALVRQAVEAGGQLLVFGDQLANDTSLLNVLISGTTTGPLIDRSSAAGPFTKSASAPSAFAATAASLIWQNGTYSIEGWNPADMIYSSGATAAVACRAVGFGRVGFIAYDFYCPQPTAQAADWRVVARAMASYLDARDCNGNGIADAADIANHTASDCNGNGVLDSCDIASGAEVDLNADGFPDSCQSAIVSWGDNTNGQRNTPSGVGFVSAIDGGWYHTVALRGNGTVACWGSNSFGQCTPPVGLSSVLAISAGQAHTVALKSDGTVVAWGAIYNENGVYGALPTPPAGLSGVVAIASGSDHLLALKSNGQLVGWGSNVDWDDTGATIGQATVPADLVSATAIGAGHMHSLAVRPDGTVRSFGWNSQGQSQPPAGLSSVVRVAGGYEHSLALKSDGTVVAWGSNFAGERDVPVGLNAVTAIAAGGYQNVALKSDGTVVSWGANFLGQATVPAGLGRVRCIGAGFSHSLAVRQLSPASAIVLVSSTPTTCGLATGAIDVTVTDALILSWTGPSGFTSTAEDLTGLAAG